MTPRPLLLFTITVPTTAVLLLTAYLYSRTLSPQKIRTIKTSNTLSPTTLTSPFLHILNPRSFTKNTTTDSRFIILSKHEIGNLTDEEILVRLVRGFFGGWVFWPEKGIISLFRLFGRKMVPVGFTGMSHSFSFKC